MKSICTILVICIFLLTPPSQVWALETEQLAISENQECESCLLWSVLFPGLTHLAMNDTEKGFTFLTIGIVTLLGMITSLILTIAFPHVVIYDSLAGVSPSVPFIVLVFIFQIAGIVNWLWSLIDAYYLLQKNSNQRILHKNPKPRELQNRPVPQ